MYKLQLHLVLSFVCLLGISGWAIDASADEAETTGSIAPTFTLTLLNPQDEYEVGEQWLCKFEAKVTAPEDRPVTIRAWSRFYAEYEALDGPIDEIQLSDVLALGLPISRNGEIVVRWNAPNPEIFKKTSKTVIPAGESKTVTFYRNYGGAIKANRFRRKSWFAIVIEPEPDKFMLLYSRLPVDLEFVAKGEEISSETYFQKYDQWEQSKTFKLHDEVPVYE